MPPASTRGKWALAAFAVAWIASALGLAGRVGLLGGDFDWLPPLVTGVMAAVVALPFWWATDQIGGEVWGRWRSFRKEVGSGGRRVAAIGLTVVVATLVYGADYLSTGNEDLEKRGQSFVFQGPARADHESGFYVGAEFRVSDVDGCDEPVTVTLAAFDRRETADEVADQESAFAFENASIEPGKPGSVEETRGPRNGIPVAVRADALLGGLSDDRIEGEIRKEAWRSSPVVAVFEADLLETRTENSCWLLLPQFLDASGDEVGVDRPRLQSWTRVDTDPGLTVDAEVSSPPPDRDINGFPVWKCERERGACAGAAVIAKENAEELRDLNLLAMGLFLSLGSAAFLEGLLQGMRRDSE